MTPPTHLTPDGMAIVVAAAIQSKGRLLAARRIAPLELAGGWELPGGKVEPGEAPTDALVRELREELDVQASVVGQVHGPRDGDWPLGEASVLRVMRVRIDHGDPTSGVAHDQVRWLGQREVGNLAWLRADVAPAKAAAALLDTWVDFPAGAVLGQGVITAIVSLPESRCGVVVDRTPFHPLDHSWPDQPGDTGHLGSHRVIDSLTGTLDDMGNLRVGDDIGVRRADPSRTWVVVHVLETDPADLILGNGVALAVDASRRQTYSRGHSACHLAALALNEVSHRFWSKEPPSRDSRGFAFLDQITNSISRIHPDSAYDGYRCGKSLRKAGFDSATFLSELRATEQQVNDQLDRWIGAGGPSSIDTGGDPTISARRTWVADIEGVPARIPCGGTHVQDIHELGHVAVRYAATEQGFEVTTIVA